MDERDRGREPQEGERREMEERFRRYLGSRERPRDAEDDVEGHGAPSPDPPDPEPDR